MRFVRCSLINVFGFKADAHTGRGCFYSWPRVKSVLLIILLSADMICEVAANELLLYTITVAARGCVLYLVSMRR
jgi:hypothetical protein